eukprot:3009324-Rhodomonas_salina.1
MRRVQLRCGTEKGAWYYQGVVALLRGRMRALVLRPLCVYVYLHTDARTATGVAAYTCQYWHDRTSYSSWY